MTRRLAKRPPTIEYAQERLERLVSEPHRFGDLTYNRSEKPRLMRLERRKNVQKVLVVLIRHVDLVTGRIIRPVNGNVFPSCFADCSLSWLCHAADVSRRTLCRVLADLVDVGWLDRRAQKIIAVDDDTLAVATVIRSLTERFFAALGLGKDFARDKIYQKGKRIARKVITLFRLVGKAKRVPQKQQGKPCPKDFNFCSPDPGGVGKWLQTQLEEANANWNAKLHGCT